MPCYVPSSVYHMLPVRERRVTFNLDVSDAHGVQRDGSEQENDEESDLRLAVRLQEEENAAALRARRRERAEAAGSGRRRSGRSCAHGFGLSATPLSTSTTEVSINDALKTKDSPIFGKSDTDPDATTNENGDAASASPSCAPPSSSSFGASIEGHLKSIGRSSSFTGRGRANGARIGITNEEKDGANAPSWLQIRRAENSVKETARAAQKMLEEKHGKMSSARRRSGMGVFAPKWW